MTINNPAKKMMIPCKTLALILLLQAATAEEPVAPAAPKPAAASSVKPVAVVPKKPESRQITANAASGLNSGSAVGASGMNSVYPYNMYANSLYSSGLKPSAAPGSGSSGGFLSLLRPGSSGSGSGRRSSLTSRIRSLVSSIFRRGEQPSYLGSASNYNYALRQPPVGFNGNAPQNSGLFGSQGGSNPNLFSSASNYQPIAFPSPSGSQNSGLWSNYKQWASPSAASNSAPGSIGSANTANYAWSAPSGAQPSPSFGSNSNSSPSFQGTSGSSGPYQAAASNQGYQAYNGYNQRSGSAFKPVPAAGSASAIGGSGSESAEGFQGLKPNSNHNII